MRLSWDKLSRSSGSLKKGGFFFCVKIYEIHEKCVLCKMTVRLHLDNSAIIKHMFLAVENIY